MHKILFYFIFFFLCNKIEKLIWKEEKVLKIRNKCRNWGKFKKRKKCPKIRKKIKKSEKVWKAEEISKIEKKI